MAYLEKVAEDNKIDVGEVKVYSGRNDGTQETYAETSASLKRSGGRDEKRNSDVFLERGDGTFPYGV